MDDAENIEDLKLRLAEAEAALRARDEAAATREQTARAHADLEDIYRSVFNSIDEGLAIQEIVRDHNGQVVDVIYRQVNRAFEFQGGVRNVVNRSIHEVLPGVEEHWLQLYHRVASTGEAERVVNYQQDVDRWFEVYFSRIDERGRFVATVFKDITDRKRADDVLRESEERQAFLLKLSDAMRSLNDPDAVADEACRLLVQELKASRAQYTVMIDDTPGAEIAEVRGENIRSGDKLVRQFAMNAFGRALVDDLRLGRTGVVANIADEIRISVEQRALHLRAGSPAHISVPRVRDGRLVVTLTLHDLRPREWTSREVTLVQEVAERTWAAVERARAETAQRESEERFRQFAASSADGLWIRDTGTMAMEYVSPAIATIYDVPPDAILGNLERWAALIVPEDREAALAHLEQARAGATVVREFRTQRPSDGAFRWIRDTAFPLHDDDQIPRIGGIAQDVTEARLAVEHTAVLLAELQHRVRNIMAQLRAITARTGERAASVPEYAALMAGRLITLARVQALLTRAANAGVGIARIVRDELDAQAHHEGQFTIEGPDLVLSPKSAEVLTLAVHELATNALKYGGLAAPNGHVTVCWSTFEKRGTPWLGFDWIETGAPQRPPSDPAVPRRRGFGSELIEGRIPYELGGRGTMTIEPGGARCHFEFPLRDGASILETDAPQRATVFGGALDMTDEADLGGHRVLVVEDDFYLATDAARALRGAGAKVLGPCPNEVAARDELAEQRPDAAVIDINLGSGPSFKLAETLKDRGIPFVFTTGYDMEVIPAEFDGVARLQKPVQLRQIVVAIAKLVTKAA